MKPLLEVLKENGEMPRQEAIDAVVDKVGLSEEQLSVLNEGNGKSKARGRVGWASSYLRVAGALDGPRRGYFALGKNAEFHVQNYGAGIEDRLTGDHETQRFDTFSYGVSDRGASIRIPWQVEVDKKGYLEDRRPNANADPYVIATVMIDTVCSSASS